MTGDKNKTDTKSEFHLAYGEINPADLSTGGQGSGMSGTDTGGLDGAGNELGATSPGNDKGRGEGKRMEDADAGARQA